MLSARERWSEFCKQIEARHRLLRDEARQEAAKALVAANYDPIPIAHAWSGIQNRLQELERRIVDTWNEKVEATYESEGIDRSLQMADREKGASLAYELENAREACDKGILADAARAMYARAVATQKERLCPVCGAPLDVPFTYQAVNLTCRSCRTISTFEPGTLMRNVLATGAHALAWEAAHAEWLAMRAADRRARAHRSPTPLAALKDYERAQIAYWWKYATVRATLEPERGNIRLEVSARMAHWYESAEHEEQWRDAGRPRDALL
jgi:hypothetical protein